MGQYDSEEQLYSFSSSSSNSFALDENESLRDISDKGINEKISSFHKKETKAYWDLESFLSILKTNLDDEKIKNLDVSSENYKEQFIEVIHTEYGSKYMQNYLINCPSSCTHLYLQVRS